MILRDSERTLELTGATLGLAAFGIAGTENTENGICSLINSRLYALEKIAVIYLCLLKCIFILSVTPRLNWQEQKVHFSPLNREGNSLIFQYCIFMEDKERLSRYFFGKETT